MGEASNGVEETPAAWTPPPQPAIAAPVPPSAAPDVDNAKAPDFGNKTGAAAGDHEARPIRGTGIAEVDAAAIDTGTRAGEKSAHGTILSSPATPPMTPKRDVAPPTRAGEHDLAADTSRDVDTSKPDGCTTPVHDLDVDTSKPDACRTPVHDLEGTDRRIADGYGSPLHKEKPKPAGATVNRDVAAAKSRLLTFRSFLRDKKVNQDVPPLSPVHGKAGEDGAEHKGKERRKRFWK